MNQKPRSHSGFSLIELMIAMTIGLLLLSGLTMIFINSSNANRELQKTSQQIENGRYAIDMISTDMRLAGFYGHLHNLGSITVPGAAPDPCEATDTNALREAMWFPVQGYRGTIATTNPAADTVADIITTTSCDAFLPASNLKEGSDVIVVRRADTNALLPADTPDLDVFYLQSSATTAEIQKGRATATAAISTDKNAKGTASIISLSNLAATPPASPIRKYKVHIYFVSKCSSGKGAGGLCDGSAGEDTIPTLKRLELEKSGTIKIVALVEGIEFLKVEWGVDNLPAAMSAVTGYVGDGTVDDYTEAPGAGNWGTVIAAKVYLLARNTELTAGYTDIKSYRLGALAGDNFTVPPASGANARYKRHVYTAAVQLVNVAGRREIP